MSFEKVLRLISKTVKTFCYQKVPPLFLVRLLKDDDKRIFNAICFTVLLSGGNPVSSFNGLKALKRRADFLGVDGIFYLTAVNDGYFLWFLSGEKIKVRYKIYFSY